ncbi:MAG: menaquinone biosynthesis protein [Thermoguttaceae bacterium]
MTEQLAKTKQPTVRIGAVGYLNARPLILTLPQLVPEARITVDLPSRLADGLADGRLDVAMVPSIEYFRNPEWTIVSDACVACDGPVRSVKLFGRVPVERIRTLALDEGSRTSAALVRILLKERFGLEPQLYPLPIGASLEDAEVDAVMLIGDRAMLPMAGRYEFVWDLGDEWSRWTGLPFVFAMWIARSGIDLQDVAEALSTARDEGVERLDQIARCEAPKLGLSQHECRAYLRENLDFQLRERQRQGLQRFRELAARHGLVPAGVELVFYDQPTAR